MSAISRDMGAVWAELSDDKKSALDMAFKAAAHGAAAYDGSEPTEVAAFSALVAFERLSNPVLPQGLAHDDKMAAEAALSVWLGRGTKRTYSTDGLMDVMSRRRCYVVRLASRPEASEASALKRVKVKGVLIRPGKYPDGIQEGQGGAPYEPAPSAPRFQQLLSLLLNNGVHLDDMLLYEGDAPKGTVRKAPYLVLAIPRRDIEIAVCNEVGQATFIATPMLGLYGYTTFEKDRLNALPNVSRIVYNNSEQWEADILARLQGQEIGKKVSIPVFAKKKPPFTEAVINAWVILHLIDSKDHCVPGQTSGPIIGNEHDTWLSVQKGFWEKYRGLGNSPYKTLADFIQAQAALGAYDEALEQLGKTRFEAGIIGPDFTEEQINTWVILHLIESDKQCVPHVGPGVIIGNEHGDTWRNVETGFRHQIRGLENSQYNSLPHFIQAQAALGVYDEALEKVGKTRFEAGIMGPDFTEAQINTWVILHLIESDKQCVPHVGSGGIIGNEHGDTWRNVETGFRCQIRGLENGQYNSLSQFIQAQAALGVYDEALERVGKTRFEAGIIGPDFTEEQINTWVIQHLRESQDHCVPGRNSAPIIGNEHGDTWLTVRDAFKRKSRGLENSPYKTLPQFIQEQAKLGVYDEALKAVGKTRFEAGIQGPDFTEEQINTRVIQHLRESQDHRMPHIRSGPIIGNEHGDVWQNVDYSFRNKARGLEASSAESLSDFIWQQHQRRAYDGVLKDLGRTPEQAGIKPFQKRNMSQRKAKGPALA